MRRCPICNHIWLMHGADDECPTDVPEELVAAAEEILTPRVWDRFKEANQCSIKGRSPGKHGPHESASGEIQPQASPVQWKNHWLIL